MADEYKWTDNPTIAGVSKCDTDILNNCLMHLKYDILSSGFELLEYKDTNRILQGIEATGWLLQGSKVTETYPSALEMINEEWTKGHIVTDTVSVSPTENIEIPCKISPKGFRIVDIEFKELTDELFDKVGINPYFVYDNVNNFFFLPNSKWFSQTTGDPSKLSRIMIAGLPEISGVIGKLRTKLNNISYAEGAFKQSFDESSGDSNNGASLTSKFIFNASASNQIYGNSFTVQPNACFVLRYYKVGGTYVNEGKIDVANLINEINSKVDIDMSNLSKTGNDDIFSKCLPDFPKGISASYNTLYTAAENGWILFYTKLSAFESGNASAHLIVSGLIDDVEVYSNAACNENNYPAYDFITYTSCHGLLQIKKGQSYKLYSRYSMGNNGVDFYKLIFYPLKGAS